MINLSLGETILVLELISPRDGSQKGYFPNDFKTELLLQMLFKNVLFIINVDWVLSS